jgi:ribosomal protein S18 acetylase RimI-like enzyme
MQITIEIPQIEDFKKVNELAKQVHELHINWRPDLFLSVDEVISKEDFEKMIQAKEIFVAKIEDEIVGYITINIKEKNNPSMRYRKQLQIEAICVDEENRGKGIGTELLEYARKFAKEDNCTDLYLTVNKENEKAIKFYEEFGFKVKSIAYSMQI